MKNIELYIPEIKDYWYEEKIEKDEKTMSYNAGYDVSYYGYHYDTGCIDFPKERWANMYTKRKNDNVFFAYIKDDDTGEFVGYVNYQYNVSEERYECGILLEYIYRGQGYAKQALELLCDVAKKNGIKELYDSFEIGRGNALSVFEQAGFIIVEKQLSKKFGKSVDGVLIKKVL